MADLSLHGQLFRMYCYCMDLDHILALVILVVSYYWLLQCLAYHKYISVKGTTTVVVSKIDFVQMTFLRTVLTDKVSMLATVWHIVEAEPKATNASNGTEKKNQSG